MSSELMQTIELIGREKGIDPEVIIPAVEEAYAAASRKYYRSREEFGARFDRDSGHFLLFNKHVVVEEDDLADPMTEITLDDARQVNPQIQVGEVLETPREHADAALTGTWEILLSPPQEVRRYRHAKETKRSGTGRGKSEHPDRTEEAGKLIR